MKNTIVITGGGTGGHLSIAKVLINRLHDLGHDVIFIGSTKGADQDWFKDYSKLQKSYFLDTKGVVNQKFIGKFISLLNILKATLKCINIFKKHNVTKVISVGGFSASPASFAALLIRKDFYIHEQNSVMGKLNKISSKWAKEVFGSYSNATIKVDYPVSKIFFDNQKIREDVKTIIFLGGSQGSVAINNFAIKVAPKLSQLGINIIHQAGKNNVDNVKKEYKKLNIEVDCFGFTSELFEKLNKADIAVCRSGAGTVWELCALGIPALYVPYPYAAANHQYYNAKSITDLDLGILLEQDNLNENLFFEFMKSDIKSKSEGLIKLIKPNGIDNMLDIILKN